MGRREEIAARSIIDFYEGGIMKCDDWSDNKKHVFRLRRIIPLHSRYAVILAFFLLGFILVSLTGCSAIVGSTPSSGQTTVLSSSASTNATVIPTPIPTPSPTPSPTPVPEIRVTVSLVGDIIMHEAVYDGALTNPGEDEPVYDFSPDFQYITDILKDSDLVIGNFEGTLAGPPYSGFPHFNGPDAMADALYNAGFRVLCTANNHCIDKGLDGLIRTATVLAEKGFTVIGTRPDLKSEMDTVMDVDGIKIGFLNYTFETIGTSKRKALNGIPIPDGADPLICSFNPYREKAFDTDLKVILLRAEALRQQGAEAICLVLHWGVEYTTQSSAWQQKMAQSLCDGGVDLIVGHHPHVLQGIDVLTSADTGKQTLVYYSLGNFLGNWAFGTQGTSGKAQDGLIARITFVKTEDGVSIEKGEYIPTFVVRLPKGSGRQHLIVPVLPASVNPSAYSTTEKDMLASYKRINKILGSCTGTAEIPVMVAIR